MNYEDCDHKESWRAMIVNHAQIFVGYWQSLESTLPVKKFCYGWLHRRLLRRYRPQSAVNCSTLWERAAGSPPNTSQVSLSMLYEPSQITMIFSVMSCTFIHACYGNPSLQLTCQSLETLKAEWKYLFLALPQKGELQPKKCSFGATGEGTWAKVTIKSSVGDISVVTLIRTDTILDHSLKAEKVWLFISW